MKAISPAKRWKVLITMLSILVIAIASIKVLSMRTYNPNNPRSRPNGYLMSHAVTVKNSPEQVFNFITYRMAELTYLCKPCTKLTLAGSARGRYTVRDMFQLFALVIFVGSISISAYHRHQARAEGGTISRRDEGILFILGRLFVAIPLFGATVLYIINPAWMAWATFSAPFWLRWFGVGIGLLSIPSVHLVLRALGKNVSETVLTKNQQELVKSGPYRRIRHPLYSTGFMLFTAIGLIAANWFILIFTGLALVGVRLVIIPREEKELQARFGHEYTQYISESGALIPRFRIKH